jgi:uncharacterized protein (DUF302 family)
VRIGARMASRMPSPLGYLRKVLAAVLVAAAIGNAHADDLLMVRSLQAFPEAMLTLQEAIRDHGYTVSRVQHVDIGLTASGFETDLYRLVFFARPGEVEALSERHPLLVAYLPLQVAIFAEEGETLVVTTNPSKLSDFFPEADLQAVLATWERDLHSILEAVRVAQ